MKKKFFPFAVFLLAASFAVAQPPGTPKPPSIEDRLKHVDEHLNKELQLSNDQKEKLLVVYKDFFGKMDEIVAKNPPPPPPPPPPAINVEELDKIVADRDSRIKSILNPDQFKKFEAIEKRPKPRHMGRPGKDGPPPHQPTTTK